MKYVAYLDILGFKDKLKELNHEKATEFISKFASTVYDSWVCNIGYEKHIEGYIVSDNLIVSTKDTSEPALRVLLDAIVKICRVEFFNNSLLIRGAVAKGEFDKLEAKELKTLSKGLIVGQAYVDAYKLEGSLKTAGIVLSEETSQDVKNLDNSNDYVIDEQNADNKNFFVLRYLNVETLLDENNMTKFIQLACESKWLPHYYNTLYIALKNEVTSKVDQVFLKIISIISKKESPINYVDFDLFIKNSFAREVNAKYQKRFSKFLRSRLDLSNR